MEVAPLSPAFPREGVLSYGVLGLAEFAIVSLEFNTRAITSQFLIWRILQCFGLCGLLGPQGSGDHDDLHPFSQERWQGRGVAAGCLVSGVVFWLSTINVAASARLRR